mmetsp:Transcript_12849/g.16837  ORF Transcript_12849/g.16837 Transcript_12849/m.16837 type:complete len:277 (-) Transcript_12849:257-1087(-)
MNEHHSQQEEEEEEEPWIEDVDSDDEPDGDLGEEEDYGGVALFSTDQRDPNDEFTVSLGNNNDKSITLTGIKAKYPHLLQSTGMTLWKGSKMLCDYLIKQESATSVCCDKTVIELGAGLGLCGIVAYQYCQASQVIMTDGDTDTLSNLRKNVNLNIQSPPDSTRSILCKQLLWGKTNVQAFCDKYAAATNVGFDVVMGGDVAYAQESLEILFETALQLLSTKVGSLFILSFAFRGGVTIQDVLDCAKRHNLKWVEPQDKGDNGDGVYVFSRALTDL